MKHTITTEVKNGKLSRNRKLILDVLSTFEGKEVTITIQRKRKQRSGAQNAYLHGYLFPAIYYGLIEAGFNKESISVKKVKEEMKSLFLRESIYNEKTDRYIEFVKGTSECSTVELSEFIDNCIRWASEEIGIILFYPNEQSSIDFM